MPEVLSMQIRTACRAAIYGSTSLLALTPAALILAPPLSRAQTVDGTVPSVVVSVAGNAGTPGPGAGNPGGPGYTPDNVTVELTGSAVVQGGGVQLTSTGGVGGEGSGSDHIDGNGGAGGAGAAGSVVSVIMDGSSTVNSTVAAVASASPAWVATAVRAVTRAPMEPAESLATAAMAAPSTSRRAGTPMSPAPTPAHPA